jgi:hypothetical protein
MEIQKIQLTVEEEKRIKKLVMILDSAYKSKGVVRKQ